MWWVAFPAIASAVKLVIDNNKYITDISARYQILDKENKTKLILALHESGISQQRIAKSLGVSPSAISQRLKSNTSQPVSNDESVSKLFELHHIGIPNQAIAKLLSTDDIEITGADIDAFFKVNKASKLNLG
ncbi:winged helix-turn-helix transcriptional regulator [Pseudoalteromonas sp. APC 3691]|uniref:winged helix-turn-helix transcriptional regulator n=1 Tax=Pseudoalteromonas sp. APC 3691 TaxID=3035173 RepID=UPI0025B5639C|nr:winged helix-turn-helix transcriptional regulator [Pseudoalteromonas sp. APC 3691]MDN3393161.1 winged helix-turn-helix transcriptional regulator [Pseudoalteromonas sp. APC 3691]